MQETTPGYRELRPLKVAPSSPDTVDIHDGFAKSKTNCRKTRLRAVRNELSRERSSDFDFRKKSPTTPGQCKQGFANVYGPSRLARFPERHRFRIRKSRRRTSRPATACRTILLRQTLPGEVPGSATAVPGASNVNPLDKKRSSAPSGRLWPRPTGFRRRISRSARWSGPTAKARWSYCRRRHAWA